MTPRPPGPPNPLPNPLVKLTLTFQDGPVLEFVPDKPIDQRDVFAWVGRLWRQTGQSDLDMRMPAPEGEE